MDGRKYEGVRVTWGTPTDISSFVEEAMSTISGFQDIHDASEVASYSGGISVKIIF